MSSKDSQVTSCSRNKYQESPWKRNNKSWYIFSNWIKICKKIQSLFILLSKLWVDISIPTAFESLLNKLFKEPYKAFASKTKKAVWRKRCAVRNHKAVQLTRTRMVRINKNNNNIWRTRFLYMRPFFNVSTLFRMINSNVTSSQDHVESLL